MRPPVASSGARKDKCGEHADGQKSPVHAPEDRGGTSGRAPDAPATVRRADGGVADVESHARPQPVPRRATSRRDRSHHLAPLPHDVMFVRDEAWVRVLGPP